MENLYGSISDEARNKDCCKNCDSLMYYDGYFCGCESVQDVKDTDLLKIDYFDLETRKCELFQCREGNFWTKGSW